MKTASVSALQSDTGAGGSYLPVFSENGYYVVFVSQAENLVPNDDLEPWLDIFRWDRVSRNLVLVSANTNGFGGGNGHSQIPAISADGQYIVFASEASNLAANDTNRACDIYLRDVASGTTTLVSRNRNGSGPGNAASTYPLISADGRFAFFESQASDLVLQDRNQAPDVFRRDLQTGQTILVSQNAGGSGSANGRSRLSSISRDGRYVTFVSQGTDLVAGVTNALGEVYVRDMQIGRTIWASAFHPPGAGGTVVYPCQDPVLNREGTHVAYKAGNVGVVIYELAGGTNDSAWRWAAEPANSDPLCISTNGRYLVYATTDSVLFAGHSNKVVRLDTENLAPDGQVSVEVVSATNNASNSTLGVFSAPRASADGQRILFVGTSTSLVAEVATGLPALYYRDMGSGVISVLSTNLQHLQECSFVDLSLDGCMVVFETPVEFVTGDHNRSSDVFFREVSTDWPVLISRRTSEKQENTAFAASGLGARGAMLSADGNQLLFLSGDGNIAPKDTNYSNDPFLMDLATGKLWGGPVGNQVNVAQGVTNQVVHTSSVFRAILSADGRFAAYDRSTYSRTEQTQYGRRVYRLDRLTGLEQVVSITPNGNEIDGITPSISHDGRFVAYCTRDNITALAGSAVVDGGYTDVVLCDFAPPHIPGSGIEPARPNMTNRVLSVVPNGERTGNSASRAPLITPDSRWVVFSSSATDLTTNGTFLNRFEGVFHLYAYDLSSGLIKMLDRDMRGVPYSSAATNVVFSPNSEWAAFQTTTGRQIYLHPLTNDSRIFVTNLQPGDPDPVWSTNLELLPNLEVCQDCRNPSLSQDGRYVAFESRPPGGPTNIIVRDMQTQTNELISLDMAGTGSGNGPSHSPLISPDGRHVVFVSLADNLVAQDQNGKADIFIRDRAQGKTWLVSRNMHGTGSGNGKSLDPVLSADGRTLAFRSFANDLVANDFNDAPDVFVLRIGGADSDHDGMDDDWEVAYFGNLASGGDADPDADGASNLQEFRAGTDPTNGNSVFRAMTLTAQGPGAPASITVLWSAVPGKIYRVQYKRDLAQAGWADLPGDVLAESATAAKVWEDTAGSPALQGFYRVVLVE